MTGVFMSTRWHARGADASDPNLAVLSELREIKQALRGEIARVWLDPKDSVAVRLKGLPAPPTNAPSAGFPETLKALWHRVRTKAPAAEEFRLERERRMAENRTNLTLLAGIFPRGRGVGMAVG